MERNERAIERMKKHMKLEKLKNDLKEFWNEYEPQLDDDENEAIEEVIDILDEFL